MKTNNT